MCSWQIRYTANVNCASVVGWYCRFMVYFVRASACVRVSVCGCGWSWSFQGDFNIYYCFPLLLDVSSEVNVSPICPHFSLRLSVFVSLTASFFLSSISSHLPLSSLCCTPYQNTGISSDWYFFASRTFPLSHLLVFFLSVLPSLTLLPSQSPLFFSISIYYFQKTTAYLLC